MLSEKWQLVLDSTTDAVFMLDAEGALVEVNSRLSKLLRHTPEQLVGTQLSRWIEKDCGMVVSRVLKQIAARRVGDRFTCVFATPDREQFTFEVQATPMIESGEVRLIGCVGRDITQEAVLERKLWDTAESHHQTVDFALRTSLGLIKGYVYTLGQAADVDQERRKRYVGVIEEEMEHMSAMIEDLLDLKCADAGQFETRGEMVSPVDCVQYAVDQCAAEAERREVKVLTKLPTNCAPIYVPPESLHRSVFNLLQYSIQQSLHSGTVEIELLDGLAYIDLTIRSSGFLPDGEDVTRVFDRCRRGGGANGSGGSPNMSLAVTRTLIGALGGKVWLKSERQSGMEVRLMVPRRLEGLNFAEEFDATALLSEESAGEIAQ